MTVKQALTFLLLLPVLLASSQTFGNLDFETTCSDSKTSLCHWDVSWDYQITACTTAQTNRGQSLLISSQEEAGIGYVEQTAQIETPSSLKMITFTGKIKTRDVQGKGAGVTINTLDTAGNYLFVNDLEKEGHDLYTGTLDWQNFSLRTVVDAATATVKIGGILYGKGQVWFDDFHIEITPLEQQQPSEVAQTYIDQVCKIIAQHSIRRDSIDLAKLKAQALKVAGPAGTFADCHLAVRHLISGLGDHHSFLMPLETYNSWSDSKDTPGSIPLPTHRPIQDFAYLSIPGFHSGDEELKIAYADRIQAALRHYDQQNIDGWIIDLRPNNGGNMEPMLAGLGPLFSAKTVGYLVDVDGKREPWGYKKKAPFCGSYTGTPATNPVKLKNKNLPMAVLIGPQTGSSGEIVVLSFVGNKNTRLFGQPTWGISTGNGDFELPDGARLFLTSTIMADRTGKLYGGKVYPDELVKPGKEGGDPVLERALEWLTRNQ